MVLRSTSPTLPETLGELRVLPLAERAINLGLSHRSWMPLAVLASAMALVAFHAVGVAVAFFGAAVVLLLLRTITMHEAYRTVEWNILFLLGALIPLSHAVRDTGGTDLLARSLETAIHGLSPTGTLAVVMVIAMAVTPFFHNAPTVLVMGPIAGSLAVKLGLNPDPFLMAVALGRRLRFPDPHRASVQYPGPRTGRLPLRRLCPARAAALHHGGGGRRPLDQFLLAHGRTRPLRRALTTASSAGVASRCMRLPST